MKKLASLCTIALVVALLMVTGCQLGGEAGSTPSPGSTSTFTGTLELADYQKITLEEAGNTIGLTVPTPTYLPEGYEVQGVYIKDTS